MTVDPWLIASFIIALFMTLVGAVLDIKNNEVPNKVWLIFGTLGAILAVAHYGASVFLAVHFIFAAIISGGILVVFYKFEDHIGGADAKAIMALGVILSPFAFVSLGLSVFLLFGTFAILIAKEKLRWKEMLTMKTPFLPYLFLGVAVAFMALLAIS